MYMCTCFCLPGTFHTHTFRIPMSASQCSQHHQKWLTMLSDQSCKTPMPFVLEACNGSDSVVYIMYKYIYYIYIPTNVHVHVNHVLCFTTYKHCTCTQKQSISLPQEVTFVTSSLCATHQASGTREGSHGLKVITLVKYRYVLLATK